MGDPYYRRFSVDIYDREDVEAIEEIARKEHRDPKKQLEKIVLDWLTNERRKK